MVTCVTLVVLILLMLYGTRTYILAQYETVPKFPHTIGNSYTAAYSTVSLCTREAFLTLFAVP